MNNIDLVHFYELTSSFRKSKYQFSFFKENVNEDVSYWINASETQTYEGKVYGGNVTAIRFTEEELTELRDSINEILSQR